MKRITTVILATLVLFGCATTKTHNTDFDKAYKIASEFAHSVNSVHPDKVYDLLIQEYKDQITKKDFIKNFNHERSYNYLTPLFINIVKIEVAKDGNSAYITTSVAARLPCEEFNFTLYREGNIFKVDSFKSIVDGSYIKIFDNVVTFEDTMNYKKK